MYIINGSKYVVHLISYFKLNKWGEIAIALSMKLKTQIRTKHDCPFSRAYIYFTLSLLFSPSMFRLAFGGTYSPFLGVHMLFEWLYVNSDVMSTIFDYAMIDT